MRTMLLLLILLPLVPGRAPAADGAGGDHEARITYLVGGSVYVDAGREMGLAVGDTVRVMRGGATVAALAVEFLSSRRASCSVLSTTVTLAVGDLVRLPARGPVSVPAAGAPVASRPLERTPTARKAGRTPFGIHGRAGVRYLTVIDRSGFGEDFTQPSLDLNLAGTRIAGTGLDLGVDVRTRHTYRTLADGEKTDAGHTRVYRMNGSWQGRNSPFRISLGRQASSNFSSVSIFDGALLRILEPRWSVGLFGGFQPDPVSLGFATDIKEIGVYAQWRTRPDPGPRWTISTGGVGSYAPGMVDREYLFVRGQFSGGRLYGYASQEIDFNRDWKSDLETHAVDPTSTFINLRYRIARRATAYASFDNRRRVRLYRDRDTPESEFDDTYRQGYRGGVDVGVTRWFGFNLGLANHTGVAAGNSESYTLQLRATGPRPVDLQLTTRTTRYTGPWTEGWLNSAAVGRRFGTRVNAAVQGGLRKETRSLALGSEHSISWWGMNLDLGIARSWYLLLSGEFTGGSPEDNTQLYSSLSYRF